jgi:hypothetical protein
MSRLLFPPKLKQALEDIPGPAMLVRCITGLPTCLVKVDMRESIMFSRNTTEVKLVPGMQLYPTGAVIRLYLEFKYLLREGYGLDAYLNPSQDHEVLKAFATQPTIMVHLFDMKMIYITSRTLENNQMENIAGSIKNGQNYNNLLDPKDLTFLKSVELYKHELEIEHA